MTIATRIGMPLEAFIREHEAQPFELINGERRAKLPTITGHNDVADRACTELKVQAEARDIGIARMEATYVLPDNYDSDWVKGSRTPDVLFIRIERLKVYREEHPDWRKKPYLIVPDLVVEVVSPNDKVTELDEKIEAYLADGVRLIWVLKPQSRTAIVYAPDVEQPRFLAGDAMLEGGEVVPGFKIALAKLFE